ncbi:MAG: GntR family transcriptional regulator [Sphaerochaetaceae bacterium]
MDYTIVQLSLSDRVYDILKDRILSGELQGGMGVPEEQLAQQFGVSRTPIREAIHRLAEYGLVVLRPRNHATVYTMENKEATDIAKVRITLEHLAVDSITKEEIEQHADRLSSLADDCHNCLGTGNRAQLWVKDSLFHLELVKCANNKALTSLYERLDAQIQLLRIAQNYTDDSVSHVLDQHGQIIQYLQNGDTGACKTLLVRHITHT